MKKIRDKIYLACGITIIICISLIGFYFLIQKWTSLDIDLLRPVFILESLAIFSFSISWMVKGGWPLSDRPSNNHNDSSKAQANERRKMKRKREAELPE